MRRRSLTGSIARTAVLANVAGRSMAKGAAAAAPAPAAAPALAPEAAAPVSGGLTPEKLDMLKSIAELKTQGVLSDAEFEVEKAKILHA